ncbi:MAG: hypothetical protein JMDDDDMK_03272 [Acidobacteria bacterium]|nr:hypothetical protein [Acidobacteriota bacterium]
MIDIPAVKLAVGDDVNACQFLNLEDDFGRVNQRLLAGQRDQPFRRGIRTDDGSAN